MSGAERATVNGDIRANLHIVVNHHVADLRHLQMLAAFLHIAKAIAAHDGARVNPHAIAQLRARVQRDVMKNRAVLADHAIFIHIIIAVQNRAGADLRAVADDDVRADASFRMHFGFFGNNGGRMDARGGAGFRIKERYYFREGNTRAGHVDEYLALGGKSFVDDDRTGGTLLGAFKEGAVLGEGEIAGACAVGGLESGEWHRVVAQHFAAQFCSDISRCEEHGESLSFRLRLWR